MNYTMDEWTLNAYIPFIERDSEREEKKTGKCTI